MGPRKLRENIHIREVNQDTWERYEQALQLKNKRHWTNIAVPQERGSGKQGETEEQEGAEEQGEEEEGTHKRLRRNRAMPGDGVSTQQGNARGIKRDGVPKKGQGPKKGRSGRNKQTESDERSKTVVKTAAQPYR